MGQFQGCGFGQEKSIFNGYCFRKWEEKAELTKEMIGCLRRECQLEYNSVIGIQ